jgi:nucleoid DNA-binding protein
MTKIGYNPKTGQKVAIGASRNVKFSPSKQIIKEEK